VQGVPARPAGWMSAAGHVLDFSEGYVTTDAAGDTYQLRDGTVQRLPSS